MSLVVVNARLDIQKLFKHLSLSLGVGILSSLFTGNSISSYPQTDKMTAITPPTTIFPVIWTILYIAMGIAAYIIDINCSKSYNSDYKKVLYLYYAQLFLNFMWPITFFKFASPILALANIIILIIALSLTILGFAKYNKHASFFMLPHLSWCIFTLILNITFI